MRDFIQQSGFAMRARSHHTDEVNTRACRRALVNGAIAEEMKRADLQF